MARNQQDPYYEIRPVLENAVAKLASEISKQEQPVESSLVSGFLTRVRKLKKSNDQLRAALAAATLRKGELRYRHIDEQEVASRTRFVDGINKRLGDLEAFLNNATNPSVAVQIGEEGENGGGAVRRGSPFQSAPGMGTSHRRSSGKERGRSFEEESLLRDSLAQQNQDIDYIAERVSEINRSARVIGEEVDDHNE